MAYTDRADAVALAKDIEHEPRFTCEIVNHGTVRKPAFVVYGVDSYRQEENGVGNWFFVHFMTSSHEHWTEYRSKLREFELAHA